MPGTSCEGDPSPGRPTTAVTGTDAPPWVRVRALSKTFGSVRVLDAVDFDVRAGEIHGLVGQNGSGKSTLIKVLSGVHAADPGSTVEVNGTGLSRPVSPQELRRHGLAFVHQNLGLVDECSVVENIRLGQYAVKPLSRSISWRRERAAALATLARLHSTIDPRSLVSSLPAGDKAVVAIGRALQGLPEGTGCIIFDESTRALPREILPDFYDTVRRLAASGTAIVLVSHRLDEVLALTDRVTVLQDGRVVAGGLQTRGLTESALARLLLGRELELTQERAVSRRPADGHHLRAHSLTSPLLRSVDLDVAPGEVVGVIGASGSGHAELPYALAGEGRGLGGTVEVGGRTYPLPLRSPGELIKAGLAMVPEDRAREGLAVDLSALENLTLPRTRARGRVRLKTDWQEREFAEAVELVGIVPPRPGLLVSSYSGGNQQKILLAKWLLNSPVAVVLHEPTQAVDVGARMDILRAVRATAARGVSVVISSIESQDLAAVCDRVIVMRDGEVAIELTGDLTAHDITAATYPVVAPNLETVPTPPPLPSLTTVPTPAGTAG